MAEKAERIISTLSIPMSKTPVSFHRSISPAHRMRINISSPPDYIAGMTDRFAGQEFKKLTDPLNLYNYQLGLPEMGRKMKGNRLPNVNYDKITLDKALKFSREILPSVSRTFDLAIRFLPARLGRPVGLAYLLCRIADTFEDSDILSADRRRDYLLKYGRLFNQPHDFDKNLVDELKTAFTDNLSSIDGLPYPTDNDPSHILTRNLDIVLLAVDSLPDRFKNHIFQRVQEMSYGMADYTLRAAEPRIDVPNRQINFLEDEADWDRYCYYVAGTVGHMLTDIFSDYAGFTDSTRHRLHDLGRSFGLGLQKVNILKDAVVDTGRGICFLPKTYIDSLDFVWR
jgi:phytoene/squalene synthetase